MRAVLEALGVLAIAALTTTCGPGRPPLSGSLNLSVGCTPMPVGCGGSMPCTNPGCPTDTNLLSGAPGTGTPPLQVTCTIQPSDAGPSFLLFTIVRTASTVDVGYGLSVCGAVTGPNTDMTSGTVNLYLNGSQSLSNNIPGSCHVHVNTLDLTNNNNNFSGTIECMNVQDSNMPSHFRFIAGTSTTANPAFADFNFVSCGIDYVPCGGH